MILYLTFPDLFSSYSFQSFISALASKLDQDFALKIQIDSNQPILTPYENVIFKNPAATIQQSFLEYMPSYEVSLPPSRNITFRYQYPAYLEPGNHLIEVTQTSNISVHEFKHLNYSDIGHLKYLDIQNQRFYIDVLNEIGDVNFFCTKKIVPINTLVHFYLKVGRGSDMAIHFNEEYTLVNGTVQTTTFDLAETGKNYFNFIAVCLILIWFNFCNGSKIITVDSFQCFIY